MIFSSKPIKHTPQEVEFARNIADTHIEHFRYELATIISVAKFKKSEIFCNKITFASCVCVIVQEITFARCFTHAFSKNL